MNHIIYNNNKSKVAKNGWNNEQIVWKNMLYKHENVFIANPPEISPVDDVYSYSTCSLISCAIRVFTRISYFEILYLKQMLEKRRGGGGRIIIERRRRRIGRRGEGRSRI